MFAATGMAGPATKYMVTAATTTRWQARLSP